MTNHSTEDSQKNNKRNRQELIRIFAISLLLIIVVPLILMKYNESINRPQVMEINMPSRPVKNDTILLNTKIISLYLTSANKIFYSIQDGKNMGGLVPATNLQVDSLFENDKSPIILLKPCKGSSYQNVVDMFDKFSICAVKRYALVDATEEEENKIKIRLEEGN